MRDQITTTDVGAWRIIFISLPPRGFLFTYLYISFINGPIVLAGIMKK